MSITNKSSVKKTIKALLYYRAAGKALSGCQLNSGPVSKTRHIAPNQEKKRGDRNLLKVFIVLILVVSTLLLYHFFPLHHYLKSENLIPLLNTIRQTWWAPLAIVSFLALSGFLALPASPIVLAVGAIYSLKLGFLYNFIGLNLGAILHFVTARLLGRNFVDWIVTHLLKGRFQRFNDKAARHGFRLILYMRMIPMMPFIAVNFGAAVSKIKFRDYALASFIGMIPGSFVYTYFAASLLEGAAGAQKKALLNLLLSFLLFVFLSLVPTLFKKFLPKKMKDYPNVKA